MVLLRRDGLLLICMHQTDGEHSGPCHAGAVQASNCKQAQTNAEVMHIKCSKQFLIQAKQELLCSNWKLQVGQEKGLKQGGLQKAAHQPDPCCVLCRD